MTGLVQMLADMISFNPLNLMTCYYYHQFIDKKTEGKGKLGHHEQVCLCNTNWDTCKLCSGREHRKKQETSWW